MAWIAVEDDKGDPTGQAIGAAIQAVSTAEGMVVMTNRKPQPTDEQIMAWYERNIRPIAVRQLWKDWWRIVRLIHRGKSLYHCEAIDSADRLFAKNQVYNLAMTVWFKRDYGRVIRDYSLASLPRILIESRMRKAGMLTKVEIKP